MGRRDFFQKKLFMVAGKGWGGGGGGGKILKANFEGRCSTWARGTNDQVIPRGEDFRKMFSNLKTVNLKVFPNYSAIFT